MPAAGIKEAPTFAPPDNRIEVRKTQPVAAATKVILVRNAALNKSRPSLRLPERPTQAVTDTARKVVDFQRALQTFGGKNVVREFNSSSYNILWLEQIIQIDPKKVALALETKQQIDLLIQKHDLDPQYAPAMALGAFVGLEKLEELGLTNALTRTAIDQLSKAQGQAKGRSRRTERFLLRHLKNALKFLPQDKAGLIGKQRNTLLVEQFGLDLHKRLERRSRRAKILKQTQGYEVEVLSRMDYSPPGERFDEDIRYQLEWAESNGVPETWLHRGTKLKHLKRTDWHLTSILGLKEDVAERANQRFEMSTTPTLGSPAQFTTMLELTMGGFVTEKILSNTWEKYSMHVATTFPTDILNDRSRAQYIQMARSLSGAYASIQRGVYGGYIYSDAPGTGREVADKTLESDKFTTVAGGKKETTRGKSLIEMRLFDLTEGGQYGILTHKPHLDFAFRCYWQQQVGMPLANSAEYRAANLWQRYYADLSAVYEQYGIENAWWGVGWKKAEDPQLQKDLEALNRKYAFEVGSYIDQELDNPEPAAQRDTKSSKILGLHKIQRVEETGELPDTVVQLSEKQLQATGLKPNSFVSLRLGEKTVSAKVLSTDKFTLSIKPAIGLGPHAQSALCLPQDIDLTVRYDPTKLELAFGPTFGIAANVDDPTLVKPFGDQTEYHKASVLAGRKRGVLAYVFDPHEVDLSNGTIQAMTLDKDGKRWIRISAPLPDMVFNRNFGDFPDEVYNELTRIPFINPEPLRSFIGDKLLLAETISSNPKLKQYMPETRALTNSKAIEEMVKKHRIIYIKPQFGEESKAVTSIEILPDGKFQYDFTVRREDNGEAYYDWVSFDNPGQQMFTASSVEEIIRMTKKHRQGYTEFIIQQGIEMLEDDSGSPTEARFLFQRGSNGNLDLIGWNEGQRDYVIQHTLKPTFRDDTAKAIAKNSENLAHAIALQIQSSFGPSFGQMSVQTAVDKYGKVWLLEANSRPGVINQFTAYKLPQMTYRASEHLVDYVAQASGYSEKSVPLIKLGTRELSDGTRVEIAEERNPYPIYQFAQTELGDRMSDSQKTVYNLRSLQAIGENLASRTRYITVRSNGHIVGCLALIQPYEQWLRSIDNPDEFFDTKPRWEIGGELFSQDAKQRGLDRELFETALKELRRAGAEEAVITIPGTYDKSKPGVTRDESSDFESMVQGYDHRLFGYAPKSYGPTYLIKL